MGEQRRIIDLTQIAPENITGSKQLACDEIESNRISLAQIKGYAEAITATGFNKNLSSTDNTNQKVADKFDKYFVNRVAVRQTVLKGRVDTNGRSDFLDAGLGLDVTQKGTEDTYITIGDGYNTEGSADYVVRVPAGLSWDSLTDDTTNYLFIEYNTTTGVATTGSTVIMPAYAYARPTGTTTGQYWYPIDHRKCGEAYNGSAWEDTYRVYVGECITAGGAVTSVTSYAYQGKYVSEIFTVETSSNYSKTHNIGTNLLKTVVYGRKNSTFNFLNMGGGSTAQASASSSNSRVGLSHSVSANSVFVRGAPSHILAGNDNYGTQAGTNATDSNAPAETIIFVERSF